MNCHNTKMVRHMVMRVIGYLSVLLSFSVCHLAAAQLSDEETSALQGFKLDTSFTCVTKPNGIEGCWDVPICVALGETSSKSIIEFTSEGFFLRHIIQYRKPECNAANVLFVQTQSPPEDWDLAYKIMTRDVKSGQKRETYKDIFFTSEIGGMTGENVGFKLKAEQLCVLPSQITQFDFSTLSDGLLDKWQYEKDYFFSRQYLDDMTACLSRAAVID